MIMAPSAMVSVSVATLYRMPSWSTYLVLVTPSHSEFSSVPVTGHIAWFTMDELLCHSIFNY